MDHAEQTAADVDHAESSEAAEIGRRLDQVIRAIDAAGGSRGTDAERLASLRSGVLALADVARSALARAATAEDARLRAESESAAKDEFLALLSHELRTPVGGVLIWTQLLRTAGDDHAAAAKAADMIERSTRSLIQLVNDLLDASRIVAGKLTIEVRPVDLGAVVAAAAEGVLAAAEAKGVRLERNVAGGTVEVAGDPSRLQQVIANLLSNAVKSTGEGGRIGLSLDVQGAEALVRVEDEVPGVEPLLLPGSISGPRSRESDRGGLGLGLLVAQHLVELHHGELDVDGGGSGRRSTFSLRLPLLEKGAREAGPVDQAPRAEVPAGVEGMRVLLVDDEEGARAALGAVLELRGATVTAVSSCREALASLEAERPDVLLSDIAMPVEDGYDLIRKVREREGAGPHVPAVAVTAYAAAEDRQRALRAGFQEHIPKPVDPDHLIRVLARVAAG